MKRAVSAVAALTILLSILMVAFPVSSQATTLLLNWDFEDNNIASLGTPNGSDADGYYAVGDVSIVPGGASGSSYALKISGAEVGNGQWLNDLKPGTKYTVSFYAKIANWGGSAYPHLGVNGYDGDAYVTVSTFTEAWAPYQLTFETGATSTTACVYTWTYGSGAVDFFVDNVSVAEKPDDPTEPTEAPTEATEPTTEPTEDPTPVQTKDWSFEHNNLAALGTPDGSDADGYYAVGDVSIVPGGANGTNYALKISGAEVGNGQWLGGLKPGTKYTVSFWAKIANWGGSAYPHFGVNGYNGDAYVAANTFTEDWKQYQLTFETGATSTTACLYTWIYGSGTVDFFVDEVVVSENTGDTPGPVVNTDPMKNWNFEHNDLTALGTADGSDADGYYAVGNVSIVSGGANGTKYSLKISGAEVGNGQWLNNLKPDTKYKVTFYAKIANWGGSAYPHFGVNGYDGDAYVTATDFNEGWRQYKLIFKTGKSSTTACIYTWIYGSGTVDFFVDEVQVSEAAPDEKPTTPSAPSNQGPSGASVDSDPMKDWDFEHNKLSALGTPDGADADGYYAVGDVRIVSGGANDTKYALKISGAEVGNGQWIVNLKPGTKYTVIFYAKIANWGGSAYPHFGVNGYDGDAYVASSTFTEDWKQYHLTFTTGADSTMACIYTWTYGSGDVDFFIDEVTFVEGDGGFPEAVVKTDPLADWDFEHNDLAVLGTPDGGDADAYYAAGKVSIVPDGANGTNYSLLIQDAESGNGQWVYGLKPETWYEVTFYAKIANWGGNAYPNFGANGYNGDDYVTWYEFTETWEKYKIEFQTGEDSTSALIYTWIYGEGPVDFYIDEIDLHERGAAEEGQGGKLVPGPSRESGSGETVLFASYTKHPYIKWFWPLAIAGGTELAAIAGLTGVLLHKRSKSNKKKKSPQEE